jgi:2-polyprenyl-6-methoxyphenol hydroxylase-like FAD-dependent oxidoreductase
MSDKQVLVVGAGPTGLLLAGQLARHGTGVRIVDRQTTGCQESRALAIHARTLELLDRIGLAEEFVARGKRVRAFSLWDGRRRLARIDFGALDSAFPFLLDLPQHDTEMILRSHLARLGISVEQGTEVTTLVQRPESVQVTTCSADGCGQTSHVPYVVGCDGAHSTVRRELGMPFEGHGYGQDWLLADVALDWDRSDDEVHVLFNPHGRATVFMPMRDGRWRLILYFADDRPEGAAPTLDEVAELVARRMPGRITVSDASWLAAFRTHRRSAPGYRRGRVLLAGDAVHIHSPAGGQGMNTGLLDADNLAWKLAAVLTDGAPERLLDTYEAERRPVAHGVLGLSHKLVRLSSLTSPWQRALRDAALPLGSRLPRAAARAAGRISQLSVHYRGSPLTEPPRRRPATALRPGDRAPDARLRVGGTRLRLHELLRGPHHTLLLLLPDAASADPIVRRLDRGALRVVLLTPGDDPDDEVRARYGDRHALHLIRPDGYLAASGLGAIESYLDRVFGAAASPPSPPPGGAPVDAVTGS